MDDELPPPVLRDDPLPDGGGHSMYIIDFSGLPGAEDRRAERERTRSEAHRIHRSRLIGALIAAGVGDPEGVADVAMAGLFVHNDVESGEPCICSCHPHLPEGDSHDYGLSCHCTRTAAQRRAWWEEWQAETDAYWASPEGRAEADERQQREDELRRWLAEDRGMTVTEFGGFAPEQWRGTVDGHTFYFRERHDQWRIELDLRPTGRFHKVFKGGDFDDDSSFELEESLEGDVIAEGTTGSEGYGATLQERAELIARTIRKHVAQIDCRVHVEEADDLELLFGRSLQWCPACGLHLGTG